MTVYVDDFRVPKRIGRINGRWSHLTADTPDELHEFAARIGLRRSWFQGRCRLASCDPCPHFHYDVVEAKRGEAISAGATAVTIRELGDLVRAKCARMRGEAGGDAR